jgi:hypothetical protein
VGRFEEDVPIAAIHWSGELRVNYFDNRARTVARSRQLLAGHAGWRFPWLSGPGAGDAQRPDHPTALRAWHPRTVTTSTTRLVGDNGAIVLIEHHGESADAKTLFGEFGFTPEAVVAAAERSPDNSQTTTSTREPRTDGAEPQSRRTTGRRCIYMA